VKNDVDYRIRFDFSHVIPQNARQRKRLVCAVRLLEFPLPYVSSLKENINNHCYICSMLNVEDMLWIHAFLYE